MSKNIKGINIKIGAETTGLDKALKDVNDSTRTLQKELREVNNALKFSPDSVVLLEQKQTLLSETIATTTEKLDTLKKSQEEVNAAYERGDISAKQLREYERELTETASKQEHYTSLLDETTDSQKSFGDALEGSLDGASDASKALQDELKEVNESLKFDESNADLIAQKQDILTESIGETTKKLEQLQSVEADMESKRKSGDISEAQYRDYQRELINTKQELQSYGDQLSDTETKQRTLGDAVKESSEKVKKSGEAIKKAGDKTQDVGKGLTKGVTAPIIAGGTAAVLSAKQFDDSYAIIRKSTGATGKEAEKLDDSFKNVFKDVPQSASDVATAMSNLNTLTGETGADLESLTKKTLEYARVNEKDAGESATLLARLMKGLDQDMSDLPLTMDKLTFASQKSGIEVDELSNLMIDAGPAFEEMGFGMDEQIALFSQFTAAGANPKEVVSSLNIAMTRMAKDGVVDAEEAFMGLIKEIEDAPTIIQATEKAAELFGAKTGGKIADDIQAGRFNIDEWLGSLENAEGTLERTAKASETFGDKLSTMKNQLAVAFEPLGVSLIDTIMDLMVVLKPVIDTIGDMLKAFNALSPATKNIIFIAVGIVAALGPVLVMVGKVISLIGTVTMVAGALGVTVGGLLLPILAVVAAIAAAIAIGIAVFKNIDKLKDMLGGFMDWLQELGPRISTWMTGVIESGKEAFASVSDWAQSVGPRILEWLAGIGESVQGFFAGIWEWITGIGPRLLEWLTGVGESGKEFFLGIGEWISTFFSGLGERFLEALAPVLNIPTFIGEKWEHIKEVVATLVLNILTGISELPGKMMEFGSNMLGRLRDGIVSRFGTISSTVSTLVSNVISGFTGLPGELWSIGSNVVGSMIGGLRSKLGALRDTASELASTVGDKVKGFFGIASPSKLMTEYGGNIGEGLTEGMKDSLKGIEKQSVEMGRAVTENNHNLGGSLDVNISGTGASQLDNDMIARAVEQKIVREISGGNRNLPNAPSMMPF